MEKFSEMYDEPKGFGALLASMYEAGARGLLDQHSNDFEQLVHDKPQTFPEFLKMNNKIGRVMIVIARPTLYYKV